MLHAVSLWCLVAGLSGAGLFNAIGTPATQSSFVRWGYPAWWCRLTGGLELMSAALIALPSSREVGLIVVAVIVASAVLTVLRQREFSHLVPLGVLRRLAYGGDDLCLRGQRSKGTATPGPRREHAVISARRSTMADQS